jgi:CBS domain-containing protein
MLSKDLDAIIVLNSEVGNAIGSVAQSDLLQAYTEEKAETLMAMEVMQENIPQIPPDIPIATAVQMMLDNNIHTYFLMHHSEGVLYPAAYISYKNILLHLAAKEEHDLRELGVDAERRTPLDLFIEMRDAARRGILKQREE